MGKKAQGRQGRSVGLSLADADKPKPAPTCARCLFARPGESAGRYECHRFPRQVSAGSWWPSVEFNDWCGEYKPKAQA